MRHERYQAKPVARLELRLSCNRRRLCTPGVNDSHRTAGSVMSAFPNSPKLIKGGLVLVDAETATCCASFPSNTTPNADAHAASAGRRRVDQRSCRAGALQGPGGRDLQARSRHRRNRSAGVSRPERDRRASSESSRSSPCSNRWCSRPRRSSRRSTARLVRAHSRSRRCWRRSRCSYGARVASCQSRSPTSASPRKLSTLRSIRSARR